MKRKKNILDRKVFTERGISSDNVGADVVDAITLLDVKYTIAKHELSVLADMLEHGVSDIVSAFSRHREITMSGKSHNSIECVTYVYGSEEIAEKVRSTRRHKGKVARYGVDDIVSQLVIGYKGFSELGITTEQLTPAQYTRILAVLKYEDKHLYPYDWQNTVAHFVENDLTNYVSRLRRLKIFGDGVSLSSYCVRYGKLNGAKRYADLSAKKTKHLINTNAYWEVLGVSDEEKAENIRQINSERGKKAAVITRGTSEFSCRSVAYWIKKGFSEEVAKEKVYDIQTLGWKNCSDRDSCIHNWLQTLAAKTDEEKDLINLKKGHSPKSYVARLGVSEEVANEMSESFYSKRNLYSGISQKLFFEIVDMLGSDDGIYFKTLNYERQFGGKCVDFYDSVGNTIVEFDGDYWHANPSVYSSEFMVYGRSAKQIWLDDRARERVILEHCDGVHIARIWESDYVANPDTEIERMVGIIKKRRNNKGV